MNKGMIIFIVVLLVLLWKSPDLLGNFISGLIHGLGTVGGKIGG